MGPPQVTTPTWKTASMWGLHRLQLPLRHVHLLLCRVLCCLQVGYLLWHGPPWATGGQPAPLWSSQAAGKSLLWQLKHVLPSFFSDLGVCRAVSLTFFLTSLSHGCYAVFFTLSYHRGTTLLAERLSSVLQCVCWRWLEAALSGTGQLPDSAHKGHPCSTSPISKTWAPTDNTDLFTCDAMEQILFVCILESKQNKQNHRIIEWWGLERALKVIWFQPHAMSRDILH